METKSIETENKSEGEEQQLSPSKPTQQQQEAGIRSPLGFLKKRVKSGSGKKRRGSGHSEGDCESVSTIDEERSDKVIASPSSTAASRRLSLDSVSTSQPIQNLNSKERPRQYRGIAKVFHDLKYRSRVRKSHSAPPAGMDNTKVSSPVSVATVDDDSFSSYATAMGAHSSGYSTPLLSSNLGSPETSLTESFVEEDEEQADDTTTVEESHSPAQVIFNPFGASPLPPNISRLVCGVYIVGPTLRRIDVADPSALPNLLGSQVAAVQLVSPPSEPASPSATMASSETLAVSIPKASSLETEPVDVDETLASPCSTINKPEYHQHKEEEEEEAPPVSTVASSAGVSTSSSSPAISRPAEVTTSTTTTTAGQRSRIPLLSQHRSSVPCTSTIQEPAGSLKAQQPERSSSNSEFRFCFSEYVNGEATMSPTKGLIRSLPIDPKPETPNNTVRFVSILSHFG